MNCSEDFSHLLTQIVKLKLECERGRGCARERKRDKDGVCVCESACLYVCENKKRERERVKYEPSYFGHSSTVSVEHLSFIQFNSFF